MESVQAVEQKVLKLGVDKKVPERNRFSIQENIFLCLKS